MSSFTETFGGSPVNPADVAYAAYNFSTSTALYWPQFANGQPNVAARFMNISTTAANLNVSMPDTTQASIGYDTIIFNSGTNSFNVVTYNGDSIVTIAPDQTYYLIIDDNSTQNGSWQTVQFGVGTGSANAASLAGAGLLASAGLLQVNLNGNDVSSSFTLTNTGLAQLYVWKGGVGTITLPNAPNVGNGFFFMVANNGSGTLTLSPVSGTIDGNSTSVFSQTQSGFVISDGMNWFTVGKGIQNTFSVTLLNLNVSGSSNITETSAQAQNIIQQFTGILTGNISVIVPATVQLYDVNNATTGAFSLTVRTPSGTGVVVPQGQTSLLYCDGTNIVNGLTASVTSTFSLLNGSAPNPSLSFANSPTTGLFSPGSNLVSLSAGSDEVARFASQASSVNYLGFVASSTGNPVAIGASGTDANISINIVPKGAGTTTLGLLDDTIIGSLVPLAATFTSLTASTSILGEITASGIDGTPIGSVTSASGKFTTLSASSTVSGNGFSTYLASPPAIGGSAAAAGAFTTLSASSTVSGNGFSTYLASPPAIGGSTPAAVYASTFTGAGTGLTGTAASLSVGGTATSLSVASALPIGTTATTGAPRAAGTNVATQSYVDNASHFGSWTVNGYGNGTPYQAATDGIVVAYAGNNSAGFTRITGKTDGNSTPSTVVVQSCVPTGSGQTSVASITMPVRKGDYWSVLSDLQASGAPIISWLPLGN